MASHVIYFSSGRDVGNYYVDQKLFRVMELARNRCFSGHSRASDTNGKVNLFVKSLSQDPNEWSEWMKSLRSVTVCYRRQGLFTIALLTFRTDKKVEVYSGVSKRMATDEEKQERGETISLYRACRHLDNYVEQALGLE